MTYLFRCTNCGFTASASVRDPLGLDPVCCDKSNIVRDYRAENAGIGRGVKVSRDGTMRDQAETFLPTNRELAGPGDPDGTKGMRAWREKHLPRPDNKQPFWPGEVEKKVY